MIRDWTPIYNIFDPLLPLVGKQESLYVEREDSPLARLRLALQPGRRSQKVLLVGQRGSGKSSLLAQLSHRLAEDYFLIWIDLNQSLDVYSLTIVDLLLGFAGGIYKVARSSGIRAGEGDFVELVGAINTLLGKNLAPEEFLDKLVCAKGDPSAPLDIVRRDPDSKENFSLKINENQFGQMKSGIFLREILKRTNQISHSVQQELGTPLMVIVDGLDKIRPTEAQQIFEFSELLGQLNFPFIATLPHSLYLTESEQVSEYFDLINFPNIRISYRGKPNKKHQPGYQLMRTVCQRRLAVLGLQNPDDVIEPAALDLLIKASGGILRGVIRAFRNAILYAEARGSDKILLADAEKTFAEEKQARMAFLQPGESMEFLKRFRENGSWKKEELSFFLELFQQGAIVGYANEGQIWYEVNPVLLPLE